MNKKLLSLSLLAITSIALSACGKDAESASSTVPHTHEYFFSEVVGTDSHKATCACGDSYTEKHKLGVAVTIKEATCVSTGLSRRTCSVCKAVVEETLPINENHSWSAYVDTNVSTHKRTCAVCKKVETSQHSYVEQVPSAEAKATNATCSTPATYYLSCACGRVRKSGETFAYGDTIPHTVSSLAVKTLPNKVTYDSYETFNTKGLVLTYTCEVCGQTDDLTNFDDAVIAYQSGNTSFRAGETYVTLYYGGKSVQINGLTVNKVTPVVKNFKDYSLGCEDPLDLRSLRSDYGSLTFTLTNSKGEDVTSVTDPLYYANLDASFSPYTLTANILGNDYVADKTQTVTVEVKHKILFNEATGLTECSLCGTPAVDNYYYNLATKAVDSSDLVGDYASYLKNNDVVDAVTGLAPDYSSLKAGDKLRVKATKNDQTVYFNALAVSDVIASADDFNNKLWYDNAIDYSNGAIGATEKVIHCTQCNKDYTYKEYVDAGWKCPGHGGQKNLVSYDETKFPNQPFLGYYVFTKDIESLTTNSGSGTMSSLQAGFDGVFITYFGATVDGRKHHVNDLTIGNSAKGIFGAVVRNTEIKNIYFDNIKGKGLFGYRTAGTKYINIHAKFDSTVTDSQLLGTRYESGITFVNCEFELSDPSNCLYGEINATTPASFSNTTLLYNPGVMIYKGIASSSGPETSSGITWKELPHTWEISTIKEATCISQGQDKYVCSECSYTYIKTTPMIDHNLVHVNAEEATNKTDGHIEGYECSMCKNHYNDQAGKNKIDDSDWYITRPHVKGTGTVYVDILHGKIITDELPQEYQSYSFELQDNSKPITGYENGDYVNIYAYENDNATPLLFTAKAASFIETGAELVAAFDASTKSIKGDYYLANDIENATFTSAGDMSTKTNVQITLDGRGYTINKIAVMSSTGGIFGSCGNFTGGLYNVTLKNLNINNVCAKSYGMFGYCPANSAVTKTSLTLENVNFKSGQDSLSGMIGGLCNPRVTLTNCVFDFQHLGPGSIFHYQAWNTSGRYGTFTNVTVIYDSSFDTSAKRIVVFGQDTVSDERNGSTSKLQGITFVDNKQ